jgi:hypothetical protein
LPRRVITPLALALLLSACAVEQHEIAESGKSVLIGMSDTDIRMCAGHPNNEDKIKGGTIWMYEHGAASPGGVSVAPVLPVFPFGGATIGESGNGYCRVQLRMENGRVTEVSYAGATSELGERDAVCAPIVRNCLDYRRTHPSS